MREKMAGNTSVGTALVLWTVFFYKGAYAVLPVYLPVPGMQTDRIPFLFKRSFLAMPAVIAGNYSEDSRLVRV